MWGAIVTIVFLAIAGFIVVAILSPSFLTEFSGYLAEVIAAVFGPAVVGIVINNYHSRPRGR